METRHKQENLSKQTKAETEFNRYQILGATVNDVSIIDSSTAAAIFFLLCYRLFRP